MELRLADEEKKEDSGSSLKLSGMDDQQTRQNESTKEQNPWDYDEPREPAVISSISSTVETDTLQKKGKTDGNIVLTIGKIVVYICFILEIASMAWICTQETSEIYVNLLKFQGLYSLCALVCFIDAILVNVLYERKISLIVITLFFNLIYPMQRNKHIKGTGGMGSICCLCFLVAAGATFSFIFKAVSQYGGIVQIVDDETRTAAVQVMDQTTSDGQRYGDKIMKRVFVNDAVLQKQGNYTIVAFEGNGSIKIEGDAFLDTGNKNIETQMGFVKEGNGTYKLKAVILDGVEMSEYGAAAYWNGVILN